MTPQFLTEAVIRPTLAVLGEQYQGAAAERLLLAIARQESGLRHRVQIGGPARGLWQFEKGGGVAEVLSNALTKETAQRLCGGLLYAPTVDRVHVAIADNDILACGFARLFLWPQRAPMPETAAEGWDYYLKVWRPGKPRPQTWAANWGI